jgi:DNA-binding HxlR family transcriptional regulator
MRRPNAIDGCPLTAASAAIGGKWKMIIVYWLAQSTKHFAAVRLAMPGISQKVLTQQLRELVDDGLVERKPQGPNPAPVLYSLTEYGRSWVPLVEAFRRRGRAHINRASGRLRGSDGRVLR